MNKIFIAVTIIILGLTSISVFSKELVGMEYDYKITRVIDGDTVAFQANFLPAPLKQELSIRVYGVDTPEKGHRAECPSEAKKGQEASAFTKALVKNATTTKVVIMKWDKYGGRVIGDVILDGKS